MITLNNYEEWFLLYIDGELNKDQIKEVNIFLLANPALQAELDALQGTVLPIEKDIHNWNFLKKNTISETLQNKILADIDNEITAEDRLVLHQELQLNPQLHSLYKELADTKLPHETIVFPNKEGLLRKERTPLIPLWIRYASIAAILLFSFGLYWKSITSSKPSVEENVAISQKDTNTLLVNKSQDQKTKPFLASSNKPINENKAPSLEEENKHISDIKETDNSNKTVIPKQIVVDQDLATVNTSPSKSASIPTINTSLNNSVQHIDTKIPETIKETNTPRSGKRIILASNLEQEDRINIANTSVNLSKALGFFKKNKTKNNNTEYKKIAIASFEINVKTSQL